MSDWKKLIFSDTVPFEEKAGKVWRWQREHNPVYDRFCRALGVDREMDFRNVGAFPLLPLDAFRETEVYSGGERKPEVIFRSSGTGTMDRAVHRVADASLYRESLLRGFRSFYDLENAIIWAYTPGYASNPDSSLVWMLNELIKSSGSPLSGFLDLDRPLDGDKIAEAAEIGRRLIIFGAAFGLADLAENDPPRLPAGSLVIETGGMKTHRREMGRGELHRILGNAFHVDRSQIHSEYGMAELLSQAYATGGPWFRSVPWMKVSVRNPDDPGEELPPGWEGLVGVIDLANVHSCSFLLTGDRGKLDRGGRFQVTGRWNPRDMRGCNFLIDRD